MTLRTFAAVFASGLITVCASAETWNNYASGYNPNIRLSSERDTQIGMGEASATWTIDDFHFPTDSPTEQNGEEFGYDIMSISWVGVREVQDRVGFGYDVINWRILTQVEDTFTVVQEGSASETAGQWSKVELPDTVPNFPNYHVFEGTIDLSQVSVILQPGVTYWVGVQLVGNEANATGGTAGRGFVAASVAGHPESSDQGWNYDAAFTGSEWAPASDRFPLSNDPVEFSYQINAEVVPEPASIGLLAVGALFFASRRRSR